MTDCAPNYCIIGAGAGGLTCARHAIDASAQVTVLEQTDRIGGTWVYTDAVGQDRNGVPIHTSMYEGLRTNLPRQIMGFPDWAIESDVSYVKQEEVLRWLESYARKFNLHKLIKFEHQVIKVSPVCDDSSRWEVIVKDLQNQRYDTYVYDYVMVCNGHYTHPFMPDYIGMRYFEGLQLHSHDYRSARQFQGHDLLLVGAGYSSSDIAIATVNIAKSVTISHHKPEKVNFDLDASVLIKPAISQLTSKGVIFEDGSEMSFSAIIYCTGYRHTYPFLSVECGIRVEDNHVQPLYKHVININRPTMALIGVPFFCIPTQTMDLQARFCLKFFTREKKLPSREDMLLDMEADIADRKSRGLPRKWMHKIPGDLQQKYYEDLAATAGIEPVKPVILKLFSDCMLRRQESVQFYRDINYEVVNDEEFRVL